MYDFRNLVNRYSRPVTIEEETGGEYDYDNGGKWKPETRIRETTAAVFNLSSKDIKGIVMQYGEGGGYTKADIKLYIHEPLTIGAKITHKGKKYTVSTEVDHEDHAHGLRIYIAKGAGKIENANN